MERMMSPRLRLDLARSGMERKSSGRAQRKKEHNEAAIRGEEA
jgi:hypothetical protein